MSSVTRRGLLTGGVGLIVGAGLTGGIDALTSAGSGSVTPRPAAPGEELMTEHGVLKRVLLAYRAIGDQLAVRMRPPVGVIADAAQIISDYVESFHEGLEEAYVFPRVAAAQADLVRTLLVQHDRGRHLTAAILAGASADLSDSSLRATMQNYLSSFVRMYEPHEAREDTVIYPALRVATTQRVLDQLAETFATEENRQYGGGALQQVLDRVTGVEEQLGIGDLNSFTPA